MQNPFRIVATLFIRATPAMLLAVGCGLALLDFSVLYASAERDDVLTIPNGIGLLQDYGLLATVAGNAILFYLARYYYEAVCSIRSSKAVAVTGHIEDSLSELTSMLKMDGKFRFLIYLFFTIGLAYWISNIAFHVFASAETRWGHKVFDSTDHPASFVASRLHNAYTWLFALPFVGYAVIFASIQLRRVVNSAARKGALRYDLLNPDRRGGFLFIEKSHLLFNLLIAIMYVLITMHIGTFDRMNTEHIIAYVFATTALILGNRIFLGDIYSMIDELRIDALNTTKESVYNKDALSFEILKYCYERRFNRFSLVNALTKVAAIALSGAVKLLPLISKALT